MLHFGLFLVRESRLRLKEIMHGPDHRPPEPRKHIAEGSLSGFDADIARNDGVFGLPADVLDVLSAKHTARLDHHIYRRGSNHLDQNSRPDTCAYRAGMGVKGAAADDRVFAESKPLRPFRRQTADDAARVLRRCTVALRDLLQIRVDPSKPLRIRQTAEIAVPERLMARCARISEHTARVCLARQHRGQPIAVLHPRGGCRANFRRRPLCMQDLCPVPFRGIGALKSCIVLIAFVGEHLVDAFCLFDRGMVLPHIEHRITVILKFRKQRQRNALLIHRSRRRARCIDRQCPDLVCGLRAGVLQCAAHTADKRIQIVLRVLPENQI